MRVVLDTNVLISAVVYGGIPREILQAAIAGTITLSISDALIQELQGVLQRPQFSLSIHFVQNTVAELTAVADWVMPQKHHSVIETDPSDNLVIDCAIAAEADYLVTGDNHLLRLGRYGNVQIITPQNFVSMLPK
jgi:putative PIN family toxin of toxin-antitoxin system